MTEERRKGTKKLVASDGKINTEEKFIEGPVTLRFGRAGIAPNGDITSIHIDRDENSVGMTVIQARTLAAEILKRT